MLRAIRDHYRHWLRRNGLPPRGYTTDEWRRAWRDDRGGEVRQAVERYRAKVARLHADEERHALLGRLGASRGGVELVPAGMDLMDVDLHLRQLWAAVDALERRLERRQ